jgi:hypothetical protein
MPRVVPTQILEFIENNISDYDAFLTEPYRPVISTILNLTSQLPEEC